MSQLRDNDYDDDDVCLVHPRYIELVLSHRPLVDTVLTLLRIIERQRMFSLVVVTPHRTTYTTKVTRLAAISPATTFNGCS